MRSLVLFNNRGGVGRTTLTFHIAHMAARLGLRTVVIDDDPQCNISAMLLTEDELVSAWEADVDPGRTIAHCVDLVRRGGGDISEPKLHEVADLLWLLPGHLQLARFEQTLEEEWSKTAAADNERALTVTTALDVVSNLAAQAVDADVVLLDVGPSLGALNRAALLSCDAVVLPVAPDLFSLQGLKNVGPTLLEWRSDWARVREHHLEDREQADLPPHEFLPIGYIAQQHLARVDRLVAGYARWGAQIPETYRRFVLDEDSLSAPEIEQDEHCVGMIRHYASLVPIAQEARKPIFDLRQADGIGGGQLQAVQRARRELEDLTRRIMERLGVEIAS